ncbi:M90 family metallopeptidase [Halorhodospira halophila]|uniref:Zinc-dependent peptidase n=1 Tax=Halorhodospira halophila (strain DSM 244 / SL1) TaxID=349124 RepID=A1WSZ6_HALHL|nr:M90 family metallopeptidase [Halorhodospira halophila]ABM60808.1 protein of unknown function DUF980 [Halorhodospira halophila SL1]
MGWLRNWRRQRIAQRYRLSPAAWSRAEAALPGLRRLPPGTRQRLAAAATALIHEKRFEGVAGVTLDALAVDTVALQAAVPVLELGVDWYAPWTTILLYPAGFVATHEYEDEDGVVHVEQGPLIGEAWEGGPLVLSLEDALAPEPGSSVVIHECAHKLDMGQGAVNGLPPLPRGMTVDDWSAAFLPAFHTMEAYAAEGACAVTPLDPYAGQDPGEFFAVATETFFADPHRLRRAFPEVYRQLARFYGWSLG